MTWYYKSPKKVTFEADPLTEARGLLIGVALGLGIWGLLAVVVLVAT